MHSLVVLVQATDNHVTSIMIGTIFSPLTRPHHQVFPGSKRTAVIYALKPQANEVHVMSIAITYW